MERIDLYQLYAIGSQLHPFVDIAADATTVGLLFLPLMNATTALERLLGPEPPARLDFCRPDAENLYNELVLLQNQYFRDADGKWAFNFDPNLRVESWVMYKAKVAIGTFETVFRTDMQRSATYLVPKRGTYDLGDLVDRANETFGIGIREVIGYRANEEYKNAGRCYAFGLYTAAGYHCCRAVEAVIREYYHLFVGKEPDGSETWGDLLKGLGECTGHFIPDPKTISHIKHVKDYDRNPLMHLKAVLDITDADMLLAASKVAIVAMAVEILKAKLDNAPSLPLQAVNIEQ